MSGASIAVISGLSARIAQLGRDPVVVKELAVKRDGMIAAAFHPMMPKVARQCLVHSPAPFR